MPDGIPVKPKRRGLTPCKVCKARVGCSPQCVRQIIVRPGGRSSPHDRQHGTVKLPSVALHLWRLRKTGEILISDCGNSIGCVIDFELGTASTGGATSANCEIMTDR